MRRDIYYNKVKYMTDKKERKRDIAGFATGLKDLMNAPLANSIGTFIRDGTYFLYGRLGILIKHNDNNPIGSIADIGFAIGVITYNLVDTFTRGLTPDQRRDTIAAIKEHFIVGLDFNNADLEESMDEPMVETESDESTSVETLEASEA